MAHGGPIGVFDSGLGGLSVVREIHALLPAEDLLYLADHALLPYGQRPDREIETRASRLVQWLVEAGAKAVVIACNTATAAGAEVLRARFALPIIAMEPAVKPAALVTRSGVVGVLGTGGTLASSRFAGLLARYADDMEVITRPAPELVEAVETGTPDTRRHLVELALRPLLDAGADVIVLGCTHFPFLRGEIEAVCGPSVQLIDTGPAVARELRRRLDEAGLRAPAGRPGRVEFRTTGDPDAVAARLQHLWGTPAVLRRGVLTGSPVTG